MVWGRRRGWEIGMLLCAGCATGVTEDVELASGLYELTTTEVEGDCVLEGAITPGSEFVGKVARVIVEVSEDRLTLEPCDPFFDDECIPESFESRLSMLRDAELLRAEDHQWEVPACFCFDSWRGSRVVSGTVTSATRAALTWSFDLPPPPSDCLCESVACAGFVEQQMVKR